jgi:FlaA1/EpsC-like NDP-sugar epimerase
MKSVLITGGTGSFGQAFVRHLLTHTNIERICIFSRGEHAQASMRMALGDDSRLRWFIGDVRDRYRLTRACCGIDTVVHAAALKRIEVGAYCPEEMIATNVHGAMNVIAAAVASKVKRVVALSSDKAYQPISPYGQTKALAESLFLNVNGTNGANGPDFAVTRYGNVSGSAGSVIPKWREMLARGARELTVTDPDATRFFMRMDEAVALVMSAIEFMPRTLLIPKHLPAYRLCDLAEAFGADYRITGLPDWEKLHESMCDGVCSANARRMTVLELMEELENVS